MGAKLRLPCEIKTILKVPNETSATRAKNINKGSNIKEKNGFSKKEKSIVVPYKLIIRINLKKSLKKLKFFLIYFSNSLGIDNYLYFSNLVFLSALFNSSIEYPLSFNPIITLLDVRPLRISFKFSFDTSIPSSSGRGFNV